jgi:hypothetical protein
MSASRIQLILRALIPYASASSASCWPRLLHLALQLFFEVSALSSGLVSSTPE